MNLVYKKIDHSHEEKDLISIIENVNAAEKPFGFNWSQNSIREELKRSICWIAKQNDRVVAFVMYRRLPPVGEIIVLASDPTLQQRGLMTTLLSVVFDAEPELQEWWLEVSEKNTKAIHLYEKLGFLLTGTRKAYYSDGSSARNYSLSR